MRKNKWLQGLLLAVLFTALSLALWRKGALERWEYTTWDLRARYFARPGPETKRIKLILLDQSSLDWGAREMGLSWPWPREVYAPIVQFCQRAGVEALAFDVLYTEPSAYAVEDDEVFGEALRDGPPSSMALFLGKETGAHTRWPEHIPSRPLTVAGLDAWLEARDRQDMHMPRATFPIPELGAQSTLTADVKVTPDRGSVIRRANAFRVFDDRVVPLLGLSAYLAGHYVREGQMPAARIEEHALWIGDRRLPLDAQGRSALRYRGGMDRYTAAQIIQSELRLQEGGDPVVSPEEFEGAYVFFGFSAPGLFDLRPTPLSDVSPGVVIHATWLDNFLSTEFIRIVPAALVIPVTLLLALLAAWGVLFSRKAWMSVVVFGLVLPIPWIVGFAGYSLGHGWPIMVQELVASLTLVGAVVVSYATEGRQKLFIKSAFKHYLSPAVIEQIMRDPDQLKLGGERRELTIFFSDLQGFSSISEGMEPQELTRLLNEYLTDMTDIILEEGGTLDKYEGDAIIAFWNAPLNQPDHALRGCRAALRCQRKLAERREEFKQWAGTELLMRVGINTGEVVVGNMGSRDRFDYTVLGDAANLASRLEGANKPFGTYTMVSESTWNQAGEGFIGRCMGRIRVVGRNTPVRVFEPLGFKGETADLPVEAFAKALQDVEEGRWDEALKAFEQWPDDPLASRYAQRCRTMTGDASAQWDGVWNLTEK
jgi:adenylate cyclase